MSGFKILAAGVAALCVAGPAHSALVFEDLSGDYYAGVIYQPGTAEVVPTYGVNVPVDDGFTQSARILGGERDVRATIVDPVGYPGDNGQASAYVGLGVQNGFFYNSMGVGAGATASFIIQYDGVDGAMGLGPGLDLDFAAHGSKLTLTTYTNYVLHAPGVSVPTDIVVRLTDMAGMSASVTGTAVADSVFQPIDFSFAAFEAANSQLNLRDIRAVELLVTINQQSFLNGGLGLMNFGTGGGAYTPTNQILPPGGGNDPVAGVPEPGTWALMIGGFGLAGAGLRRRRVAV